MKISLNLWRWCAIALGLLLAVAAGYGLLQARRANRLDSEVARQRSELLAEQARADGWEVVWAEAVPDLLAEAAEHDSVVARLRERIRLAGARAVASVRLEATAAADTVLVADTVYAATGAWTNHYAIGSFSGVVQCTPPDQTRLSIRARIREQIIHSVAADGRLIVTARALDPGVTLEVERFVWTPPKLESGGNPWLWAAIGLVVGAGGWELIR